MVRWPAMEGELTLTVQAARPAAALGDSRTVALVGADGAIEWLAFPDASGATIFDVGADATASFALAPDDAATATREYVGETTVLRTGWATAAGRANVIDFLPVRAGGDGREPRLHVRRLVRVVEGIAGEVTFRFRLAPRPAGLTPELIEDANGLLFMAGGMALVLHTACEVTLRGDGSADGVFTVAQGQREVFLLTWYDTTDPDVPEATTAEPDWELDGTYEFWLAWTRLCPFQGVQRDHVLRLLSLVKAWAPQALPAPDPGLPPLLAASWRVLAAPALAAWGYESELAALLAAWRPDPDLVADRVRAGWLLDALATGNATGLLDPFAWMPAWGGLAAAADALAMNAGGGAHDLAAVAGLRGALALADDLMLEADSDAWQAGAVAAAGRLAMAPGLPEGWEVALGLREEAPGRTPALPGDGVPAAAEAYWRIRRELAGGAYLQARRLMDDFISRHEAVVPGPGPDPGALAATMWLAAQIYLQGPPTPERVSLPGDLGD